VNISKRKFPYLLIIPPLVVLSIWAISMTFSENWDLFQHNWFMSLTMVFGSFIAGASAEGGGAVAFPVMTLIFNIEPSVARNFSLAIQSIGMTAASVHIIRYKYKVEFKYLVPASIGGTIGIIAGTLFLVPLISPPYAKMLFVSFWLSFGVVLYYLNHIYKRGVKDQLPDLTQLEKSSLILIGIMGGSLSSILGSGLDIFSFSYITLRYHLSEKVATPTSVIIMAINSVVGFLFHLLVIRDFGPVEHDFWLVSIPVVVIGAPMGAYFINQRTRNFIARFLYLVILVQFIGAILIIKPPLTLLLFSVAIFAFGLLIFFGFATYGRKRSGNLP
jgi:uncharacterized membrane protein YfcA